MPYRLIYNQDCSHLFGRTSEAITPAHVDEMVDEVARGGAELMLINPNTQRVNYPSKVWQTFWDGVELEKGEMDSSLRALLMQKKHLADQGCELPVARPGPLSSGRYGYGRLGAHERYAWHAMAGPPVTQ